VYRRADEIARMYNSPTNKYDPKDWTPEGWYRRHGEQGKAGDGA
jgi:hypothetical protein